MQQILRDLRQASELRREFEGDFYGDGVPTAWAQLEVKAEATGQSELRLVLILEAASGTRKSIIRRWLQAPSTWHWQRRVLSLGGDSELDADLEAEGVTVDSELGEGLVNDFEQLARGPIVVNGAHPVSSTVAVRRSTHHVWLQAPHGSAGEARPAIWTGSHACSGRPVWSGLVDLHLDTPRPAIGSFRARRAVGTIWSLGGSRIPVVTYVWN